MPLEITQALTSIHGRKFGMTRKGGLVTKRDDGVVAFAMVEQTVRVTSAQLLAAFATPIQLLPAPRDPNYAWVVSKWQAYKPAGTAYAGIAAGEDLVLKYTNAAGEQIASVIETTGFLDQATAQSRVAWSTGSTGATAASFTPLNAAVMLHLLTGEIITGNSDLLIRVWFEPVQIVFNTSL